MCNMSRRNIDFFKYTELDPNDDVVFFGPITKRELVKSIEVEEEVVRRRIANKKAEAIERKKLEADRLEKKENIVTSDDELNKTFDVLDPEDNMEQTPGVPKLEKQHPRTNIAQGVLNDVTQLHHNQEEAQLLDLSVRFARTSTKPQNPESTKYLLDETIDFNKSKNGACLPTPLFEKISKSKGVIATRKLSNVVSRENEDGKADGTPRLIKLSDTFITDMIGENVLNASISEDMDCNSKAAERVGTPDIFKQKQNGIWKASPEMKPYVETRQVKKNSSTKNSTLLFPKSPAFTGGTKLPMRTKTPARGQSLFLKSPAIPKVSSSAAVKDSRPLFPKSPVAAYIHRGLEIQSMSKARHSACVNELDDRRSKSDNKATKNCKIPVPIGANVKRKLDLEE